MDLAKYGMGPLRDLTVFLDLVGMDFVNKNFSDTNAALCDYVLSGTMHREFTRHRGRLGNVDYEAVVANGLGARLSLKRAKQLAEEKAEKARNATLREERRDAHRAAALERNRAEAAAGQLGGRPGGGPGGMPGGKRVPGIAH